jgi:hypothetical protein
LRENPQTVAGFAEKGRKMPVFSPELPGTNLALMKKGRQESAVRLS